MFRAIAIRAKRHETYPRYSWVLYLSRGSKWKEKLKTCHLKIVWCHPERNSIRYSYTSLDEKYNMGKWILNLLTAAIGQRPRNYTSCCYFFPILHFFLHFLIKILLREKNFLPCRCTNQNSLAWQPFVLPLELQWLWKNDQYNLGNNFLNHPCTFRSFKSLAAHLGPAQALFLSVAITILVQSFSHKRFLVVNHI